MIWSGCGSRPSAPAGPRGGRVLRRRGQIDDAADHRHQDPEARDPEHGDGLVRSEWNRKMFGDAIYEGFRDIKRAFDPQGLLNPGKVIPTLQRCAEYGKMLVRGGQISHPDLPRF